MIAFVTDNSFSHKGKYKPCLTFDSCKYIGCSLNSTYNVIMPRLFGLSYANFMRMVRDEYNGELVGRTGGYIYCVFKEKTDCDRLVKELNKRWNEWIKR